MDTKFSVAVHVLVLISQAPAPMSSEQMAHSVGTNASYIRRILSLLKRAGIVEGGRGADGYRLAVAEDRLSLLDVYRAVSENHGARLFDIHRNPNDRCMVGRHIRPVLEGMFADVERAFERSLAEKRLSDCIGGIRERLDDEGEGDGNEHGGDRI